jgi:molybdopterin converting factor small subunit
MQIVLRYTVPLVDFTGKRRETIDVPEGASVEDVVQRLAELYDSRLLKVFYNDAHEFEPMFVVTRNGAVTEAYHEPLAGDDEIALVAGFAGG